MTAYAVVPAAGKSTRMGRPKLALALGGRSVLERVVASLRQGGVDHVHVVVGPHVPGLAPIAQAAGASVQLLPCETPDMRSTVEHGLAWLEQHHHPAVDDFCLLAPADYPTLDSAVVRQVRLAGRERPQMIVVPTVQGQRGHPVLFGWGHVAGLRALPAGQGLNAYLRQRPGDVTELPVTSATILDDLDTPDDYERLCHESNQDSPATDS